MAAPVCSTPFSVPSSSWKVTQLQTPPLTPSSPIHHDVRFHPLFSSSKGDIVLRSSDDVHYRIRLFTLRSTSGFFRTMFTLPQIQARDHDRLAFDEESESIPTHEPSSILTPLLLLLTGRDLETPIHRWSFDTIERMLMLADNWDAPGPISIVRLAITSPVFLHSDPLRVFALCSQYDWDAEKDCAARYTLQYDLLNDESIKETLETLSSKDVLCLLRIRKMRVETFLALVNDVHRFSAGNNDAYDCGRCNSSKLDNQTWKDLKQAMLLEMERRPLGDTVSGCPVRGIDGRDPVVLGTMTWKEAELCWAAKCQNSACGSANYDRLTTLKQIRQCVEELR